MAENARGRVKVEAGAKRVRLYLDNRLVADTLRPLLVWERPFDPTYYVPAKDVLAELKPTGESEHSPSRGDAQVQDPRRLLLRGWSGGHGRRRGHGGGGTPHRARQRRRLQAELWMSRHSRAVQQLTSRSGSQAARASRYRADCYRPATRCSPRRELRISLVVSSAMYRSSASVLRNHRRRLSTYLSRWM